VQWRALFEATLRSVAAIWRRQNEFGRLLVVIGALNVGACLFLALSLVAFSALPWRGLVGSRQALARVPTSAPSPTWPPTPAASPTPAVTPTPTATLTPAATATPRPTATPEPSPTPEPPRIEVTAWMSDDSPKRGSRVTVYGRITKDGEGISGVQMRTSWGLRTGTAGCRDRTDDDGTASCSLRIVLARKEQEVPVEVRFTYEGEEYTAMTSFTVR
jgi:hypothetical protein